MAKKTARYGIFLALAFVFTYVERLIPLPVPVPGIKLGLANLVVLVALITMRVPEALGISVARVVLSAVLFGSPYSFLYSLCGGLLSFFVMALLCRGTRLPCLAISIVGGVFHNLGQLLCAMAVTSTLALLWYLPALLLAGVLCGTLTGIAAMWSVDRIKRMV